MNRDSAWAARRGHWHRAIKGYGFASRATVVRQTCGLPSCTALRAPTFASVRRSHLDDKEYVRWPRPDALSTPGAGMTAWCSFEICRTSGIDGRPLSEADVPNALLELQYVGSWDGIHIFPDAKPGPDGHWQFPRISAGWEREVLAPIEY